MYLSEKSTNLKRKIKAFCEYKKKYQNCCCVSLNALIKKGFTKTFEIGSLISLYPIEARANHTDFKRGG